MTRVQTYAPLRSAFVEVAVPEALAMAAGESTAEMPGISSSVGVGGKNEPDDVKKVQGWLKQTGFDVPVTGELDEKTQQAIETALHMVDNFKREKEEHRLLPESAIVDRLQRGTFPKWVQVPKAGKGFKNYNPHGLTWGTALMRDTIVRAGLDYHKAYLQEHPKAAPIGVRDISPRNGGPNPYHSLHHHGRHVDIPIPLKDGSHDKGHGLKMIVDDPAYDRDAARAMLRAFGQSKNVARIIFNDPILVEELRKSEADKAWTEKLNAELDPKDPAEARVLGHHRTHFHVEIFPIAIGVTGAR